MWKPLNSIHDSLPRHVFSPRCQITCSNEHIPMSHTRNQYLCCPPRPPLALSPPRCPGSPHAHTQAHTQTNTRTQKTHTHTQKRVPFPHSKHQKLSLFHDPLTCGTCTYGIWLIYTRKRPMLESLCHNHATIAMPVKGGIEWVVVSFFSFFGSKNPTQSL